MDNLSEEEKKAIEIDLKCLHNVMNNFEDDLCEQMQEKVTQIKRFIEKQNKEIEQLKNLNKHQSKDITKAVDYTFELNKELEIKDKMIDELVDELTCNEWDTCCGNCTHECEKDYDQLSFCVKEYFREKVEE